MSLQRQWSDAYTDVLESLAKRHIALTFGWQDVAQRYRRSRIGAFWLTISTGVMIGAIGLVFGTLFRTPMGDFLPYVALGLIVWTFFTAVLLEGSEAFISSSRVILQVRLPMFTHVMRVVWRNLIILAHNALIVPLVLLAFRRPIDATALWAIPGLVFLVLNATWLALALAVLCTRFRDMVQIVSNALQVLFYLTPILWSLETLPERFGAGLAQVNPMFHLLSIVREPILGQPPTVTNYVVVVALTVIGWAVALAFFGRYRQRIAYWL